MKSLSSFCVNGLEDPIKIFNAIHTKTIKDTVNVHVNTRTH